MAVEAEAEAGAEAGAASLSSAETTTRMPITAPLAPEARFTLDDTLSLLKQG